MRIFGLLGFVMLIAVFLQEFRSENNRHSFVLQSTTTTYDSGLLDHLLEIYELRTGIQLKPLISGSGKALMNGRNGDCDVLLLHNKAEELQFIKNEYGAYRHDVMFNDFVVIGPRDDPANIRGLRNAAAALRKISSSNAAFISRGDNSGTHAKELKLWSISGGRSKNMKARYFEVGSGMGATLNIAIGKNAYTLSDRATWAAFANKSKHEILVEGDKRLLNQYGVILVGSNNSDKARSALAHNFVNWLIGPDGQSAIASYRLNGQQLFFPNAGESFFRKEPHSSDKKADLNS